MTHCLAPLLRVVLALLAAGGSATAAAQASPAPAAPPAAVPAPQAAPTGPCDPTFSNPQFRRLEAQTVAGTRYALAWIALPEIRVSEFFTLEVVVCAAPGQPAARTLRVDASMPEHQHGMNYRASVRPRGPGRFVAEGMLLHMPGHWQLSFEINVGAQREVLTGDLQVN
jgi:hypothetical protein